MKILSSSSPFYTVTLLHRSTRLHCLAMSVTLPCNVLPFSFGYRRFFLFPFSLSNRTLLLLGPFGLLLSSLNALTYYEASVLIAVHQRNNKFDCLLFFGQQSFLSSGFLCIAKFFPTVLVQVFPPGFLGHLVRCPFLATHCHRQKILLSSYPVWVIVIKSSCLVSNNSTALF